MEAATSSGSRKCPECGIRMTRYEWSKLWWMSSGMSGRLVQPCTECGAKLRLSSMALVSSLSAAGLIITAVMYLIYQSSIFLFVALALLLVILVAMLATRIEAVPAPAAPIDPKPPRINKPPRMNQ